MPERAYTVKEIDALRKACELRFAFGTTNLSKSTTSIGYYEKDKIIAVEEMIRTYMIAGITAADIHRADFE